MQHHTRNTWTTCEDADKRSYPTRKKARSAIKHVARRMGEKVSAWNAYVCDHCNQYHIGHRGGVDVH